MADYKSKMPSLRVNFDHPKDSYYLSRREPASKEATREAPHKYRHGFVPDYRSHNMGKYQGHRPRNDRNYGHHNLDNHHQDDHHHRHLAEGAIAGFVVAEMVHRSCQREGEEVSHGLRHLAFTLGAGALGAVAVNEASRIRRYYN